MSVYLTCNGLERWLVTFVGRFPTTYHTDDPWTKNVCINVLHEDVQRDHSGITYADVKSAFARCIKKKLVAWEEASDWGCYPVRTSLGDAACGFTEPAESRRGPEPTITSAERAVAVVLGILHNAGEDSESVYLADPRIHHGTICSGNLLTWARHEGVAEDACVDGIARCKAEAWVSSSVGYGDELIKITDHATRAMRQVRPDGLAPGALANEAATAALHAALCGSDRPARPHSEAPAWKRLKLIESHSADDLAELDGVEHRVNASAFHLLQQLQAANGGTIKAAVLAGRIGRRPDVIYKTLPMPLKETIDKPGSRRAGYRML